MIDIQKEHEEKLKAIREMPPGINALRFLSELREKFDWAISGYRNALKLIRKDLYEDQQHFILELIQNADDAQFAAGKNAELKFIIRSDSIELLYNEEGFDVEDVIAITDLGVSTKIQRKTSAHSFIGEKGIGFKSVFALASEIEIESPPWHFALERKDERYIIPKPLETGKLRKGNGTRLVINFPNKNDVDDIAITLYDIVKSRNVQTILFLQRLATFHIEDHRVTPVKTAGVDISPGDRSDEFLTVNYLNSDNCHEYILYHEEVEFPELLVKERWEKLECEGSLKRRMIVAAAIPSKQKGGYNFNWGINGRVFCYLPTKIELPIPVFLQIDGRTKADRERLYEPSKGWNKFLLDRVAKFLTNAIENWKNKPEILENLPYYIPTSESADQLSEVFSEFIQRLRNSAWIHTFDGGKGGWTTPNKALRADDFWTKWFKEDPVFRARVEEKLKINFVDPKWVKNSKWKGKWEYYNVRMLNEEHIAGIVLPDVDLPRSLLDDDDNLTELYEHLLSWDDDKFEQYRLRLRSAPIYPFEGGKRASLDTEKGIDGIYWLSVESKRSTGIENLYEYRVIDQEHTYRVKIAINASPETRRRNSRKGYQNSITRKLLKKLNVEELDENKVLQRQIDWLLANSWSNGIMDKIPMDILLAIFDAFSAKQNRENKHYLDKLSRLSCARFPSKKGNLLRIKDMILPTKLRLQSNDRLFEATDFEAINLPNEIFLPQKSVAKDYNRKQEEERQEKRLKILRAFLIACGICNRIRLEDREKTYDNMGAFRQADQRRYSLLNQVINNDYTWGNDITIETVEINDPYKKILMLPEQDEDAIADLIYEAWRDQSESFDYYRQPNQFVAKYVRYSEQQRPIDDQLWGGVKRKLIPLVTINQEITKANIGIRISEQDLKHLSLSRSFFPFVLETKDNSKGYTTEYLDSLNIRQFEIRDINSLWSKDGIEKEDILKIAIEFSELDIDLTRLMLFNKNLKRVQGVTLWVIAGSEETNWGNKPAIDIQYGETGYKLGMKLKLEHFRLKEKETIIYDTGSLLKAEFGAIYTNYEDGESSSKLQKMLFKWKNGNPELRTVISYNSRYALSNIKTHQNNPIVLFNDPVMTARLRENDEVIFELLIDENDRFVFTDAVRDLGLSVPEDSGRLELTNKYFLNNEEQKLFFQLLEAYIKSLDDREQYKFQLKFKELGNPASWSKSIIKAENAKRVIAGNIAKDVELPYFDGDSFIVQSKEIPERILAHLLAYFDFNRFKSALNEIFGLRSLVDESKAEQVPQPDRTKLRTEDIETVRNKHRNGLKDTRKWPHTRDQSSEWKHGLSPEEDEEYRKIIGAKFVDALKRGPEIYERKLRKRTLSTRDSRLKENQEFVDSDASDPKAFLLEQYNGQCQICGFELLLSNGKKWIETFRIVEGRNEIWWANRPFNVIGLCPNCHALAKHGGSRDFTNLEGEAQELLRGNTWAREVPQYNGDFYVIKVRINGQEKNMVMSKHHLNHFASLYDE